jgi:hypothetical protein
MATRGLPGWQAHAGLVDSAANPPTSEAPPMTRRHTEQAIAVLGAVTALNAAGEAWYGLGGAPGVPVEWLRGSMFRSYRAPSLVLGVAVGGSTAAAAVTAWRGSARAPVAAIGAGAVLAGWIGAQVAIIGLRSPLQPAMAGVAVSLVGLGRCLRSSQAMATRSSIAARKNGA